MIASGLIASAEAIACAMPCGVPFALNGRTSQPTVLAAATTPVWMLLMNGAGMMSIRAIFLPFGTGPGEVAGPLNRVIGLRAAATYAFACATIPGLTAAGDASTAGMAASKRP